MYRPNMLPLSALLAALALCAGSPAPARERILMDAGWRFHLASSPVFRHPVSITSWRWRAAGESPSNSAAVMAEGGRGPGWQDSATGQDVFEGQTGNAWFLTSLPSVAGPRRMLHFEGVDDNAVVYLNGKKLADHQGWNEPFDVPLDAAWTPGGPNRLLVRVENTAGPGGITGAVTLGTLAPQSGLGDPSRPDYGDRRWRAVHLPHDYVVEGTFTPAATASHGFLPTPTAWYRRTFTLPASARGKSVWIDFDGIYRDSSVYLNGHLLGVHPSGYTSFRYDIGRAARFGGRNVLAVYVKPLHYEGWWYEGGGIYRHVWLNVADPLHIAPWGTFVSARLPEPKPGRPAAPATVTIETTLANSGAGGEGVLVSTLLDDRGRVTARASMPVAVPSGGTRTFTQQATVLHPRLWSLETPRLYRLHTEVRRAARAADAVDTPFGIRTFRFDPDRGFFLNGRPVKIQGTCNHQDFAGVGVAVPDGLEYWRVRKLKEMGANAWRMSHNPPTPELLDACDRLGMLVMDENRHLGDTYSDHTPSGTPYSNLSDLADMIRRDRNHPSLIMWSMCNEEGLQGSDEGARIFAAMMKVVHRYDTTRPITSAMNGGWGRGFTNVEDLMGINYSPEVYDGFHRSHPRMPVFGSETASTLTTRGEYADDPKRTFVTSYHMTDDTWRPIAERPFMAGSFTWTGFDYKGEPTPYGWPCVNSHFGIMDMCGFPKDNYYYFQSWWRSRPIVHLMPHWNWPGREGQNIRVIAFSNCQRVELFLNGRSLGSRTMPRYGHVEWDVAYQPGTLEARGYDGDRVAASDRVTTTGAPAALRLTTDRTTLAADGEDVTVVDVAVLDARGHVVPTAQNRIAFTVTGAGHVAGVGNGNPSDHDPDRGSHRRAFNGLCMVLVGAGERSGIIRLTAASPGLKTAKLALHSRAER